MTETAASPALEPAPRAGPDPALGHIVPTWILVATWGALVILTGITVAVSWVPLGEFNLWVAMLIATLKASLVVLFFMHMRWTRPFNAVVLIVALLGMTLLISFTLTDTLEYRKDRIPDYAPLIKE